MVTKTDKLTKKKKTKKSWERGLWASQMVEHHNYTGTISSGILLCDKVAIININALYIPKVTRKDGFKCCHKQMVTTWGDRQRNYFDLIITQCIPVLKWASINKSIMNQLKVQPHPPDTTYSNIYTVNNLLIIFACTGMLKSICFSSVQPNIFIFYH